MKKSQKKIFNLKLELLKIFGLGLALFIVSILWVINFNFFIHALIK